jgi:hypothetical protein
MAFTVGWHAGFSAGKWHHIALDFPAAPAQGFLDASTGLDGLIKSTVAVGFITTDRRFPIDKAFTHT